MHSVQVKGILSSKNGMNLYRGCSHGCIYCDSRSACYHMDHDFEDIEVKANALDLLKAIHERTKCDANGIVRDRQKIFRYLDTFEEKSNSVQLSLFDM